MRLSMRFGAMIDGGKSRAAPGLSFKQSIGVFLRAFWPKLSVLAQGEK